jgi:hypothetical protein
MTDQTIAPVGETAQLLKHLHFERQDLTAEEVRDVLINGWKEVPGRTHRQLLIQLLDVLSREKKQEVQRQWPVDKDPRVQAVFEILVDRNAKPGDFEVWEAFAARRIVDALTKLGELQSGPGVGAWVEKTMQLVELVADSEHANGKTVGDIHRTVLREHLTAAAAQVEAAANTQWLPIAEVSGGKTFMSLDWLPNPPQLENGVQLFVHKSSLNPADQDAVAAATASHQSLLTEICALAARADFAFPKLPAPVVVHPQVGDLFDRLAAQKYGLTVADAMLKAALAQIPVASVTPARRVFLVATGEVHEGEETYTRHDDAPPPLCDFEVLFSRPVPGMGADTEPAARRQDLGRYSFNCSNGCGECGVRLREFEIFRSETPEGELIERKVIPEIVSSCCGSEVDVWDSVAEDTCAQVLAATPRHLNRAPTADDIVKHLKGDRGPLHELLDDMVRRGVANARGQQLTAPAEKAAAWEVVQGGRTELVPAAEFVKRSYDAAAMRPLVYGDTPARLPLSDLELECLHIGQAVQRGAGELPEGYELQVLVEKGAGTVHLSGPDGESIPLKDRDGGLSAEIDQAVNTARGEGR